MNPSDPNHSQSLAQPVRSRLFERLRLNVLTDPEIVGDRPLLDVVEAALQGGAPAIQLRDKHAAMETLLPLAQAIRARCLAYGALFIVNDRLDLALAVQADGVHLGAHDVPVAEARRRVTPGFIVGWSASGPEDAQRAVRDGADYLGAGTVWPTASKDDAGTAIGIEGVRAIASAVSVPVVAIGGINVPRTQALSGSGAAGIAVIGAVMGAPDPKQATKALLEAARRAFSPHS